MPEHEYNIVKIGEENTFVIPGCAKKIVAQHMPQGIGFNVCNTATNDKLGVSIWHSDLRDGTLEVDVVNCIGCNYHLNVDMQ
jgi:hypothetical protein